MRRLALLCAVALAASLAPVLPAIAGEAEEADYAAARAIVVATRYDKAEAADSIEDHQGEVIEYNRLGNYFVVETPEDSLDWAEDVDDESGVRSAEPDYELTADVLPGDPSFGSLWGMTQISAPAAWDTTTGSDDVVVGVIDSGVDYTHQDLAGQMWTNGAEDGGAPGVDDDGNGWADDVHGVDCRNNDGNPMDDHGHGTHVAGTIGAAANNGAGVAGVNWDVSIMALKFLSASGSGYTSDAVECLYYAINNGAHLTNNSWGGGGYSTALYNAINAAKSADQLFVAAAGNSGANIDSSAHYPSSYNLPNVVSVAATGTTDARASFSSYGASSVDLAAPGVGILSTIPGNGYDSWNGTSMAAPHVAGAAALVLAHEPSFADDYVALRNSILDGVDPVAGLSGKVATGGRLNVAAALVASNPPPSVTLTPAEGSTVAGPVTLTAAATDDSAVTQVEFFDGATSLGLGVPDGATTWTLPWDSTLVPDGTRSLKAVATDDEARAGSDTNHVTVDNVDEPPTVAVSSPASGANVSGNVTLAANASDDRGLSKIEFFVDGNEVGEDVDPAGGWTTTWAAPALDGSRTVTAVATDNASQTTTSAPVTIVVNNPAISMHVHDIDGTRVSLSSTFWQARATIAVFNNKEQALSGRTVRIRWGTSTTTYSCTTSTAGTCTIKSPKYRKSSVAKIVATVTSVSGGTLPYNSAQNHNSDGDANATASTITIFKP